MHLIHSADIPELYIKSLESSLPELTRIPLPASKDVYPSIASHPDIFIFEIDKRTLVCSPSLSEETLLSIRRSGMRILMSQAAPHGNYPGTALLNAARVGRYIFCNPKYIDKVILDAAGQMGFELVKVNQGYARCSTIPVGKSALITCDAGIAKEARENGLDAELISPGNIALPGEKYGFIGGSSGIMPDGRIVFLGDISRHPDYPLISSFLDERGVGYIYLKGLPLFDAGTFIFVE